MGTDSYAANGRAGRKCVPCRGFGIGRTIHGPADDGPNGGRYFRVVDKRRNAAERRYVMTDVAGKTIYLTGGCSGTGLAAGKILAGLGAHIVILDLNPSEPALREIGLARRAANQLVAGYRINVADRKITMGAVALAASECGAPDILINMAGIAIAEEFINMTSETFDRVIQVNVYGTRNIVEAVLPFMISRGSGKLVLAGSMGGILPVFGYTAYGTSEFAVLGLAQCLRCELKPRGIGIACFCP